MQESLNAFLDIKNAFKMPKMLDIIHILRLWQFFIDGSFFNDANKALAV